MSPNRAKQMLFVEAVKAREDIEILREQYDNSVRDYDKLAEEHRKLQVISIVFLFALSIYVFISFSDSISYCQRRR